MTLPSQLQAGRAGMIKEAAASVAVPLGVLAVCLLPAREATMGDCQRVVYLHVALAWIALASFMGMAGAGAAYLAWRDLKWDHWLRAAAEAGWLAATLTLATGSLWAHSAWNTWWTWDPRLLTSFILWAMYSGLLMVRAGVDDPHRGARAAAVLAIVGLLDVPLVFLASRWFRGVHPASPHMEPGMRLALLASVVSFSALFALLVRRRCAQLRQQALLDALEQADEREPFAVPASPSPSYRRTG